MKKEAMFYEAFDDHVLCHLCPHECNIKEGNRGMCRVRGALRDEKGMLRLYTFNYAEVSSLAVDPVEKKPLGRFYPGTLILSAGSYGCNMKCLFCQNYHIAHEDPETLFITPQDMLEKVRQHRESIGLAFTYNEPTVWYEYVLDTAQLIKSEMPEKKIVLVTNGYINPEPLKKLLPYIDAMNIDLKGDNEFYKSICSGGSKAVMESIRLVNPDITLHISRYFPCYRMNDPSTDIATMKKAYHTLKKMLRDVRPGNVTSEEFRRITEN